MNDYSLLVGLGAMLGLWRMARGVKDAERWLDAGLLALAGALVGGRAGYVALHGSYYAAHVLEALQVWQGGLSAAGALAGGLLGGVGGLVLWVLRWFPPGGDSAGLDRLALMLAPLGAAAWVGAGWPAAPTDRRHEGAWWGLPGG